MMQQQLNLLLDKKELTRTEVKALQCALKDQVLLTETLTKEMESFTYSVSHDLRGPLSIMNGFIDILLRDYAANMDERCNKLLNRVQSNAQCLTELVTGLLELSRITQMDLDIQVVDLNEIIAKRMEQLQDSDLKRNVKFVVSDNLDTKTDPTLVEKIIYQLLDNAWKFSCQEPLTIIQIIKYHNKGQDVFQIEDNGIGFDMAFYEQLFIPFKCLHHSNKYSGQGLGLAKVNKMIHKLGGTIWAESVPEKGSCFKFTLGNMQ